MAYVLARRELRTSKILEELGLSLETKRLRDIVGHFTFYLNMGRFKVLRLRYGYIEAIVKGLHGEWRTKVDLLNQSFDCTCPHHKYRRALCKHILLLLELYLFLRNEPKDVELVRKFLQELSLIHI